MDDELTCSVCLQPFEDPVVLACAHHICKGHVLTMIQPLDKRISCPICRQSTFVPPEGLKVNNTLRNILRYWLQMKGQKKTHLCGICEVKDAVLYCKDCHGPLCQLCSDKTHEKGFLQSHEIAKFSPTDIQVRLQCEDHPDERLSLYCVDCSVPVCAHCLLVGKHQSHQRKGLKEATEDGQEAVSRWIKHLQTRKESLEKHGEEIVRSKEGVKKEGEKEKEKINEGFGKLKLILEKKNQELLLGFDSLLNSRSAEMDSHVKETSDNVSLLSNVIQRAYKIQAVESNQAFLTFVSSLISEIKHVDQKTEKELKMPSSLNLPKIEFEKIENEISKISFENKISSPKFQTTHYQHFYSQNVPLAPGPFFHIN